jgi:prepilin-type N-terminal cleavage/methylation domain-containing protein
MGNYEREKGSRQGGFTLLELMIVVVIIGILAALAIPRMMAVSVRAKQAEAKGILKQIYTEQRAYRQLYERYFVPGGPADKDNPNTFAPINVEVQLPARYEYTITTADGGIATFIAQATVANPGLDGDPAPDTWTIDQNGTLVAAFDDAVL